MFDDLLGKPFSDFGRGPDTFDCWGLVIEVAGRLGIEVPDYGRIVPDTEQVWHAYVDHHADYVRSEIIPGAIVLFRRMGSGLHFGIVIDPEHFLHADPSLGVVKVRMDHPMYCRLIKGYFLHRCNRIAYR
jgi:cell wall-associated NlpC family hydrolase